MSDNGNTDDSVQPRQEGVVTTPLQPTEQWMPAQYMPATPGIPAEPLQPLQPLQPAQFIAATPAIPATPGEPLQPLERGELIPATPAEPAQPLGRMDDLEPAQYEPAQPRMEGVPAEGVGTPEGREDDMPMQPLRRSAEPAMLDREAMQSPPDDNQPPPDDNPPPSGDNQPPPSSSDNPPTTTGSGGSSVYVDTDKLSQAIPTLDGIMRQFYAVGNNTANALNGYTLDRGDSYGEAYTTTADPISSQILEALSNAGGVFGDTAEGASQMVHNYNVTEDNAVNSASDLARSSED